MTSSSLLGSSKKDLLTEYTESKRQWSIFDYPLGQPFYLLNGAVILTYLPVRYFLLTDLNDQPIDYLGLTRVCTVEIIHGNVVRPMVTPSVSVVQQSVT